MILDLIAQNSSSSFRMFWNSKLRFFSKLVRKGEWLEQSAFWMPLSRARSFFIFLENISKDILIPNSDFIGEILKGKSDIL